MGFLEQQQLGQPGESAHLSRASNDARVMPATMTGAVAAQSSKYSGWSDMTAARTTEWADGVPPVGGDAGTLPCTAGSAAAAGTDASTLGANPPCGRWVGLAPWGAQLAAQRRRGEYSEYPCEYSEYGLA